MRGLQATWLARLLLAAITATALACGDNTSHVDAAVVAGFVPAPHVPLPRVSGHSGRVLPRMQLVTITYDDDAQRDALESFGSIVVGSRWYAAVGDEYGVHGGEQIATLHAGRAPTSLSRAQIEAEIATLAAALAADRAGQVYLLYVPSAVTLTGELATLGVASAYHATVTVDGVALPYAVVRAHPSDVASTSLAAARALINTASDPYLFPADGFFADPPANDPWSLVRGEIADLCTGESGIMLDPAHPQFLAPRVYSNRSAAQDRAPCSPAAPDELWNDVSADPPQLQAVAPGGTATFRLLGWSTQPTDDWSISLAGIARGDLSLDDLAPALERTTINNNVAVSLVLRAPLSARRGAVGGVFVLSGPNAHPWTVGIVIDDRAPRAVGPDVREARPPAR